MTGDFHRIKRLPPYIFTEVNQMKARARAAGEDIVDFGMGNPDTPPPAHVTEKLLEVLRDPRCHRYSTSRGIPGLRRAVASYYGRRFGVDVDPDKETIVTLGSKEGLANLAQAITAPGDVILCPSPSYPIHSFGFLIAGASLRHVPVGPDQDLFATLERAVRHSIPRPVAIVLNYPANPTTEVVSIDFYHKIVEFCRRNDIYIVSDLAYAEIYFDGNPPPSILQVPGAKEVAVEFTSTSKTYSMPGWRIGFATGNEKLISALARVKSYLDYGAFTPIQVAAIAALNGPQKHIENVRNIYSTRRDVLIKSMASAGWNIPQPKATMFAWAPLPSGLANGDSLEFSKMLLTEANVAVSPGAGFGEYGEGFVRIALVENEQRIRQAARNVRRFLIDRGVYNKETGIEESGS